VNEQTTVKFELIKRQRALYESWLKDLTMNKVIKGNSQEDIKKVSFDFFNAFIKVLQSSSILNLEDIEFAEVRAMLEAFSKDMVTKGQSPTATTMFIYSLKSVLTRFLQSESYFKTEVLNEEMTKFHNILDTMGLYTFEYFVKEREKIIKIQQEDLLELSTPVLKVWNGILTVPLIGTLDSKRTQIVMEKLLDTIIATTSKVVILDITGVPAVDTYVANHLINTTTAARLLGSEIIITGISPNIAQIMVNLGINLSGIITRAQMEDGLKLAFEMCNYKITKVKNG
jgi:rsbT co-antagonist protein RsbR